MFSVLANVIKALNISFSKNNIYKILCVGLVSLVLCSTAYYYFEGPSNPDLGIWDAIWWGLVTSTTVGYGDLFPTTPGGKVTAVILMLTGITSFGFVTAAVASVFVENKARKGMGLLNIKFQGHIVVIGWNHKSEIIVNELIEENVKRKIVIIDKMERLDMEHPDIYFVHGDATRDEVLKKANVQFAQTVIVVADEKIQNEEMADAKSVLICLAVDRLNTDIHLIAEVLNEENVPHFRRANADDIVISHQMSGKVIVRSALFEHVSIALRELLTCGQGNEIYECRVEEKDVGTTFKELSAKYIERNHAIIVGISDGTLILNPDKDRITGKDDIIIYIAQNQLCR